MKNFTFFLFSLVLLTLNPAALWAGEIPGDTLYVNLESGVVIKLTSTDMKSLKQGDQAAQLLSSFQSAIEPILNEFPHQVNYQLNYVEGVSLEVDTLKEGQRYLWSDGHFSRYVKSNQCVISPAPVSGCAMDNNELSMIILFDQAEQLTDPAMGEAINKSLAAMGKERRVAQNHYFDFRNGEATPGKVERTDPVSWDQLSLAADMGASLIKNSGVVNIGFVGGLTFGGRGRMLHKVYVFDEMNYVFTNNSSFTINNFLGVGYARNFSRDTDEPMWYGLEVARLTNKTSNFFIGETWRLGIVVNTKSNLEIKPCLYFEDSFKKVFPGIGLGFHF